MKWYLVDPADRPGNLWHKEMFYPTTPTHDQKQMMAEGITHWLNDPVGFQNMTEDLYDEYCEMIRNGYA